MSSVFETFLSTAQAADALSDRAVVQAMLRFETALTRAQSSLGLIEPALAQSIVGTCKVDLFDVPKLARESARARCMATPLVNSLRETVGLFNPQAARFVHLGCSHQDLIDTALALVTRDVLRLIESDVAHTVQTLLSLGAEHAADPMQARSRLQPTSVTTFGLKCVQWAIPLVRSQQRLRSAMNQALKLQLGGAVGTGHEMQGKGPLVQTLMATELQLKAPAFAWLAQRDEGAALACELGLLVGSLGKIATDMTLLTQFEVAEVTQASPGTTDASGSDLATACMVTLVAAQRMPQQVATLLAGLPHEHEQSLSHWQAELATWPALLTTAQAASSAARHFTQHIQADPQRMRANVNALRASLPAKDAKASFNPDISQHAADLARTQLSALKAMQDLDT